MSFKEKLKIAGFFIAFSPLIIGCWLWSCWKHRNIRLKKCDRSENCDICMYEDEVRL